MPKSSSTKIVEESRSFGPIDVAYKKRWVRSKNLSYKREMRLIKQGINYKPKVKSIDVTLMVNQYNSQLVPQSEVDLTAFKLLQPRITCYQPAKRCFSIMLNPNKKAHALVPASLGKYDLGKRALSAALFSEFRSLVLSRVTRDDFNLQEFDLLLKYMKKIFDVPTSTKKRHSQSCFSSTPGCVR